MPLKEIDGPAPLAAHFGLSEAVRERLAEYDRVLMEWAPIHNLVARSTLPERWARHFADSVQLLPLIPETARTIVDLGSGAGFPGLVLAAALADRGVSVTLVESTGKKAAFLAAAAEAMGLDNVLVRNERIETAALPVADVVTARALAALPKLLGYAARACGPETVLILPKGQDVEAELTEAAKSWMFEHRKHPSVTNPDAAILEVRNLASRASDTRSDPPARPRRRQPERRRR